VVETIGALKDWYGDWHLAVGRCQQPKKWTQGDNGSQQKLAATHRCMTRHAWTAQHKELSHKGPTVEKRQWKYQTRVDFVEEKHKGQMFRSRCGAQPECYKCIRDRGLKGPTVS
jgi:hypothetical protein